MAKKKKQRKNKRSNSLKRASSIKQFKFSTHFLRRHWIPMSILFGLCFAIYIQDLSYEYVLDDTIVIVDNNFTKKGFQGIWDILSKESFEGYFGEQKDLIPGARYRPLSIVSFAIEQSIFGTNPAVSHFINILLYAIVCVFLYYLFVHFLPSKKPWYLTLAFAACLLYTVHPLHTEAVANIKGRDEIMTLLFSLITLYFAFRNAIQVRWFWFLATFACMFLALLSKENAITFLAIIPFTLYFFGNFTLKRILQVSLPVFFAAIVYIGIRYQVIGYFLSSGKEITQILNNPFAEMNFSEKYATIFYTLLLYLKLSFFPHPLTHDYYPFHIPTMSWMYWKCWLSLALHLVLGVVALLGIKKKSLVAYAIIFYLASLSIVSNLFFNVGTFMNERFIFISSFGACLVIGLLFKKALDKWPKYKSIILLIGISIASAFAIRSFFRVQVWESVFTLNQAAIKVSVNSARANSFMATALYNKIQASKDNNEKKIMIAEAKGYAKKASDLIPKYLNANLMRAGIATEEYRLDNNLDALLVEFEAIAKNRADIDFVHKYYVYLNGQADKNKLINHYYKVGYDSLYKSGNNKWALQYLDYAFRLAPDNYAVNYALSQIYGALGNNQEAAKYGQRAQNLKK